MVNQSSGVALLTDLYELTMACGYWKAGIADREAAFHLYFHSHPFDGGFTVACGLAGAVERLERFRFEESDLEYLSSLPGKESRHPFQPEFIDYLRNLRFTCDLDAVPEGTVVFPQEPLLRVQGPLLQAQIVETLLLNILNFQSLIATKAARICLAARDDPVVEFGLRRTQGNDSGLSASRAAYIGGCSSTSNLFAGKVCGIPVKGTQAHSWVMAFDSEPEAFAAFAKAMPDNCVLLVDTYNSLEGVRRAAEVGRQLRARGHELAGIRLDSGDLAYLSIEARKILDAAGFPKAVIVASNNLDEHLITTLKQQGAAINVWGVGTRLVTAHGDPALDGVYKLTAIKNPAGQWQRKIKLSEQAAKTTNPGILQVRRFSSETEFIGDAIYDISRPMPREFTIMDPGDLTRHKHFPPDINAGDLLIPVLRRGQKVGPLPAVAGIRERVQSQLACFHSGIKRFVNPHRYPAGLEAGLHELKTQMALRLRGEP